MIPMPKSLEELQVIAKRGHLVDGGLGVRVAHVAAETRPCAMEFVGIQNTYAESGKPEELLEKYGLVAHNIVDAVKKVIARKR